MPKKKTAKPSEQVWTYKVKIVPVRSPTKWTAGKWEKDKEALGGYQFTDEPQNELLGYQPVMVAFLDGTEHGIAQSLGGEFATAEEAENHVSHYHSEIKAGNMFKPAYGGLLPGEVVE